ncbi:MAG: hypothetical protein GY847_26750 [Proteobacteria bacterium]|nr:hypothetical protein [Pseudomonadota bacterium]
MKSSHYLWITIIFHWLLIVCSSRVFAHDIKVNIEIRDKRDFQTLADLDVSVESLNGDTVYARIRTETLKALKEVGFSVQVAVPDIAAQIPVSPDVREKNQYYDYAEMVDAVKKVESSYPAIAKVFAIGTSTEGRDILAVKISDNVDVDENEPEILFDAAIHGNEWTGIEVAVYLIKYLTNNYKSDDELKKLVDTREIWVVPMVNPDGVVANTRENAAGVDCNRDFGYMWDGWSGSTAPFSQSETRAMLRLTDENQFVMATSFHSGNEIFVFAWSYTPEHTVDVHNFRAIGRAYGALSGYPYRQSANENSGYFVVGSSKDANYGSFGTLSWSIELSKEKVPPYDEVPAISKRNESAMLFLISASGQGVTGMVTDLTTGSPLPAVIEISNLGWLAYADPQVGDFHRFLVPGTYDLRIWANGYVSETVENVQVVKGEQTNVSVELSSQIEPENFGYKLLYNTFRKQQDATSVTVDALGAPDGIGYSLDTGGYAVIDMGPGGTIYDGPGKDITVYEAYDASKGFELYGSNELFGPWVFLGSGIGTESFDLRDGNLHSAGFFKILDDNSIEEHDKSTQNAGYELDAIGGSAGNNDRDTDFDTGSDRDSSVETDTDTQTDTNSDSVEFQAISGACNCCLLNRKLKTVGTIIANVLWVLALS